MHIGPHGVAARSRVKPRASSTHTCRRCRVPENGKCYVSSNNELFPPLLCPLPNAAYAQASGEGVEAVDGVEPELILLWGLGGRLSSSAQQTRLLLAAEKFFEIARTSPLCFSWPTSWSWETFWLFFLWLVMWWTDSDSSIRPASLSFSEANSKSSLPTCSQVGSTGWEEACERALITVLPILPDC